MGAVLAGGCLIAGGTVWGEAGAAPADVRVAGGRIAEVGRLAPRPAEEVVDAGGLDVLPGLIDAHVHAGDRIGGRQLADDWASAAAAAVRTGITTVAGFVTQRAGETLAHAAARGVAATAGVGCHVRLHLTPTAWPWDWDEIAELVARGFSTFKLYTTYRAAGLYTSYRRLAEVMPRLAALGATLLVHCEDDAVLAAAGAAPADLSEPHTHALLRPERAEVEAVERVVALAARSGCLTHVVHVSTAAGVELVAAARSRAPVTCETAPHYLLLDESALLGPHGHRWLCTPPLRSAATRARLEALVAAGAVDLLATDHCAFRRADKDDWGNDLRTAPYGIAGLGALAPLAHEVLVRRAGLSLGELVARLATGPARLLGLIGRKGVIAAGADADLAVVDPHGSERPIASTLAEAYETYPGRATTWDVRHVLVGGVPAVRAGRPVA